MNEKQFYRKIIARLENIIISISNRRYNEGEIFDTVIFNKKYNKQVPISSTPDHLGSSFSHRKAFIFLACIIFFFSVGLSRMFGLQIVNGSEYQKLAEGNRQRIIPIPAERGIVYDTNGINLTQNIPSFSIVLIPQELPYTLVERTGLAEKLSTHTKLSSYEILDLIDKYARYNHESIVIEDDIEYETALSILIRAGDLPGVSITQSNKRFYTYNDYNSTTSTLSLSHVLGYLGKIPPDKIDRLRSIGYLMSDSYGVSGVESVYENYLRGKYGKRLIEVDAVGKEQSILAEEPPIPGYHLRLNIDINIQRKLEELLISKLKEINKSKASAVAVEPNTGAIIALVSLPSFDNNNFSGEVNKIAYKEYLSDPDKPLFNRAVMGTYPSGSTIKPAIAAGALQEGVVSEFTSILSTGGLRIGAWFFPDWQVGGHGLTNVRKSLAWSINTFYYTVGGGHSGSSIKPLGPERLAYYLHRFGLGRKLGIDLPTEAEGLIPTEEWKDLIRDEQWYTGDTYNLSIGQGDLLVTPLQLTMLTAIIANGGILLTPRIAKEFVDPLTGSVNKIKPLILDDQVVDAKYIDIVRLGMRDCVVYGSCRRLASLPLNVAGKTGTAQWHSTRDPHAWFTSFAPFENPEIVLTILIEEGEGGSINAVPVADQFYRWWWNYIKTKRPD